MPQRVLIADKVAVEGLELLRAKNIELDEKTGLNEAQLIDVSGEYDAIVCRSGIKVTSKVLEAAGRAGRLKAIARAGVGVDNIDLDAATANGVLILNTAEASTLSTAEHALALLYAVARKIPAADAHVRSGQWKRNAYQGTQLAGKTLGVVGMGRIGRTVALRALAMDMKVIGFDPFFTNETALDGSVSIVRDFDEFLSRLDVITFHVPSTSDTRHLLNRDRLFGRCRPNLIVINDARGEVIDEFALADALRERKIAAAGIDVYASEPPSKDHPLFGLENVVLTPHLGASTDEAQQAVAVAACEAVALFLSTGEIRGAVNVAGLKLDLPDDERCFADLAQRIGTLLSGYHSEAGFESIVVRASGPKVTKLLPTLLKLAAVELLRPRLAGPVNLINVEMIARQRGIDLIAVPEAHPPQGLVGDIVGVWLTTPSGATHRILGTCYADRRPRLLRFDNYAMDMIPESTMVVIENKDQPGMIGIVGTMFGDAKVNIADMVLSRDVAPDGTARALMVIKTDSDPGEVLLNQLRARPGILRAQAVKLPARG